MIKFSKGEEKENEAKKVLKEIMAENFSNLARDITLQIKLLKKKKKKLRKPCPDHVAQVVRSSFQFTQSGHTKESSSDCINKWNNNSLSSSLPHSTSLSKINK